MASSQSYQGYRGYQGYPYVNPVVIDVPTVDSATASRWANLPRRPIGQAPGQNWNNPVPGGSGISQDSQQAQGSKRPTPPKEDLDAVIFVDIPEGGSEVSQSIASPDSDQSSFVENTILYDPFDDRRINVPKDDSSSQNSSSGIPGRSSPAIRPNPPNSLNVGSPGTSANSGPSSSYIRPTPVPGFMTKESQLYGGEGADGFPISPIPISEFPEPPPAYSEEPPSREPKPVIEPQRQEEPPRTQVILPSHNTSNPVTDFQDLDRKNLTCHHCGMRVQTLVIKENGFLTHVFAGFFLVVFFPLLIFVYLSDLFKYKNHYCPNCNRIIAFEAPFGGNKISYVIN